MLDILDYSWNVAATLKSQKISRDSNGLCEEKGLKCRKGVRVTFHGDPGVIFDRH